MSAKVIFRIGNQMVKCPHNCSDVNNNNPGNGIIPRGLILETKDSHGNTVCIANGQESGEDGLTGITENNNSNGLGVIVVGINPGKSSQAERNYYIANGCTYQSIVNWHQKNILSCQYHVKLRKFIKEISRTDILWTDLAKCENIPKGKNPSVQTLRFCASNYLKNEIDGLLHQNPGKWLILAVGRDAWNALVFLYPNEAVVGIPHPTGSHGNYNALFAPTGKLLSSHNTSVHNAIMNKQAIWLR